MNAALESRAEVLKLARLLRREAEELQYLEDVPAEDIRMLRDQVTEAQFSAHGAALGRLASASKRVAQEVTKLDPARRDAIAEAAREAGLAEELAALQATLGS